MASLMFLLNHCNITMKKTLDQYLNQTLEQLLKREWSSRHQGKYFACPSCGARWYTHHQGCKLELAIAEKKKEMKKIPAKFELSEEDLKSAIAYWFSLTQENLADGYEIQFKSERVSFSTAGGDGRAYIADKEVFSAVITQGDKSK